MHGITLFGNDGGDYLASMKVLKDGHDDEVTVAVAGTFKSGLKKCPRANGGVYYSFDILLEYPVLLEKDVQYSIYNSIKGPDCCFFFSENHEVQCAGVKFSFDLNPGQMPEVLFKVK